MINLHIPTRQYIQSIQIGSKVQGTFDETEVTNVYARGDDVNGRAYVCFYQKFGNGTISGSMKEGELVRGAFTNVHFDAAQMWKIERHMSNNGIEYMTGEAAIELLKS